MNWLEILIELKVWLEGREWEIANGSEDFAKLQELFKLVVGREAHT